MSSLIHLGVLCVLLLVMGFLTAPRGQRQWRHLGGFLGAIGLALGLTIIGMVVVIISFLLYLLGTSSINLEVDLFFGVISIALAAGIIMFLIVDPIIRKTGVTIGTLIITEYYIQWFLIYVTVYQVLFDQLKGFGKLINDFDISRAIDTYLATLLSPTVMIAILLPVLLSVWVTVAIAKFRVEAQARSATAAALAEATRTDLAEVAGRPNPADPVGTDGAERGALDDQVSQVERGGRADAAERVDSDDRKRRPKH